MTPTDREVCEAFGIEPRRAWGVSRDGGASWLHWNLSQREAEFFLARYADLGAEIIEHLDYPHVTACPLAWCLVEDEIERRGLGTIYVRALTEIRRATAPGNPTLASWRLLRATCAERCAAALKCLEER